MRTFITKKAIGMSFLGGKLADFINDFDWSNTGPLKGLGGEAGVTQAVDLLIELRRRSRLKVVSHA